MLVSCAFHYYYDFFGYSLIAIGMGRMLGFSFPQNFNQPFAATSIQDLCRRWHMTLGTWLRSYIYIPLGGSRHGKARMVLSLLITFSGEKLKTITYWTMGSLNGKGYEHAALLGGFLAVCGGVLLCMGRELNAFAVGEENARHIGVPVRRVKLIIMIAASALIGACVSVGGSIAYVGLIVPHMIRLISGPNHRRLLPRAMFAGAVFLMLADLAARTVLSPLELPVGVVTSMIGAVVFVLIFIRTRKGGKGL